MREVVIIYICSCMLCVNVCISTNLLPLATNKNGILFLFFNFLFQYLHKESVFNEKKSTKTNKEKTIRLFDYNA